MAEEKNSYPLRGVIIDPVHMDAPDQFTPAMMVYAGPAYMMNQQLSRPAEKKEIRFCPYCGHELTIKGKFCTECGEKLPVV